MRLTKVVAVLALMIFCLAGELFAFTRPLPTATKDYTRLSHGLISNAVTAVYMDPSGSLWVGTDTGISRFNGLTWKQYRTTNSTLQSDYINCFFTDSATGDVWVGNSAGVAVFDSPKWESPSISVQGNSVKSIVLGADSNIWLGTSVGFSMYRNLKIYESYTTSDGMPSDYVNNMDVDNSSNFWLGTSGGLSRYESSSFYNYTTSNGLPDNAIRSVAIEDAGSSDVIWMTTLLGVAKGIAAVGIWPLDYTFTALTKSSTSGALLDDDVKKVLVDWDGTKWFATKEGLAVLSIDGWDRYSKTPDNNLVDNNCTTVAIGNSDNIWVGTSAGLTKIGENAIISFEKILYLNEDAIAYVTVDDPVRNIDTGVAEIISVNVISDTDGTGFYLALTETGVDTGVFSSNATGKELGFSYFATSSINRTIKVTKGDAITALYSETDVAATRQAISFYNEEVPFDDSALLDPPCFIATASYKNSAAPTILKKVLHALAEIVETFK